MQPRVRWCGSAGNDFHGRECWPKAAQSLPEKMAANRRIEPLPNPVGFGARGAVARAERDHFPAGCRGLTSPTPGRLHAGPDFCRREFARSLTVRCNASIDRWRPAGGRSLSAGIHPIPWRVPGRGSGTGYPVHRRRRRCKSRQTLVDWAVASGAAGADHWVLFTGKSRRNRKARGRAPSAHGGFANLSPVKTTKRAGCPWRVAPCSERQGAGC